MEKTFPDKYVRKAIWTLLNGIVVNSNTINCYDMRVTGVNASNNYILMTTQTNAVDKSNKCEHFWDSSILLDVVTRFHRQGNTGSRLLVDDIVEAVRGLLETPITLEGGLTVIFQRFGVPNELNNITEQEIVYRKLIRLELKIK